MQLELSYIPHQVDNALVHQRASDGYINATAMCQATGKNLADYARLKSTEAFLSELSDDMGIPISEIIQIVKGGNPYEQGTWVHPLVATHVAQWCSPKFAVAVSKWIHDWMSGKVKAKMPYHLERYLANIESIPPTHFSMLNELTLALIAPMEKKGYTLPDNKVPDISEGKMFCKWLRETMGLDTNSLPTYTHVYPDGRRIRGAKLYPNELLHHFRKHFHEVWIPEKAVSYFRERDGNALQYLNQVFMLTHRV